MGKFQKGQPKPPGSGRKKGSRPSVKSLRETLAVEGFDLGAELLELLDTTTEAKDRLAILKLIARYTEIAPREGPPKPPPPPQPEDVGDKPAAVLERLKESLNDSDTEH